MGSNYYYGIDRRATFSGGEYPPPPNFQLPRDLPDPYQLPPKLPNPKNYPLKPPPIPPTYADSNRFPPPRHIPARYDYGYGDDKYDTDGYSGGQEVFTKSQSQRSRSAPNRIPLPRIIPSDTDYRRRPDEFTDPMQDAYNLYKKDCEKKQNAAKNYNRMPGANTRSKDANLEAAAWNVANMANVEGVLRDAYQQRFPHSQPTLEDWKGHETQVSNTKKNAQNMRDKARRHKTRT